MIFCQQWMVTAGLAKWKNKIKKKKKTVLKSTLSDWEKGTYSGPIWSGCFVKMTKGRLGHF